MSEELLWPRGPREDLRDTAKLLDFIRREILTLEFIQGIDPDVEPELAREIREHRRTEQQILEALDTLKKGV